MKISEFWIGERGVLGGPGSTVLDSGIPGETPKKWQNSAFLVVMHGGNFEDCCWFQKKTYVKEMVNINVEEQL